MNSEEPTPSGASGADGRAASVCVEESGLSLSAATGADGPSSGVATSGAGLPPKLIPSRATANVEFSHRLIAFTNTPCLLLGQPSVADPVAITARTSGKARLAIPPQTDWPIVGPNRKSAGRPKGIPGENTRPIQSKDQRDAIRYQRKRRIFVVAETGPSTRRDYPFWQMQPRRPACAVYSNGRDDVNEWAVWSGAHRKWKSLSPKNTPIS